MKPRPKAQDETPLDEVEEQNLGLDDLIDDPDLLVEMKMGKQRALRIS